MNGSNDDAPGTVDVPAARRIRRPGWRDPRILGGVAVMALCVLVGGWVLGSRGAASSSVLVVDHDVVAGASLGSDDVSVRHVHLADDVAGGYFATVSQLPAHAHLTHAVAAGELLPRSALEPDEGSGRLEVPLAVAPEDLPSTVHPGATVDVWVLPDHESGSSRTRARRVLSAVSVLHISGTGSALAPQGDRQVIVTLPAGATERLATALARIADGRVLVTRRG